MESDIIFILLDFFSLMFSYFSHPNGGKSPMGKHSHTRAVCMSGEDELDMKDGLM